jgi:hypothetical protein
LKENLAAAALRLTEDEVDVITGLSSKDSQVNALDLGGAPPRTSNDGGSCRTQSRRLLGRRESPRVAPTELEPAPIVATTLLVTPEDR